MTKFEGLSLSESIKRTMVEKYENDYDLKVAETSIAEFQKYIISDKPVQSWEDLQPERMTLSLRLNLIDNFVYLISLPKNAFKTILTMSS